MMSQRPNSPPGTPSSSYHILHGPHDLCELVQLAWLRCSNLSGRDLTCQRVGQELVLQGTVRTYYQKQLAQETLRDIPGIGAIRNDIVVL